MPGVKTMDNESVQIVPGVTYVPSDQAVYVDCKRFREWLGITATGNTEESIVLAALRSCRQQFPHSKVRQYIIRGDK